MKHRMITLFGEMGMRISIALITLSSGYFIFKHLERYDLNVPALLITAVTGICVFSFIFCINQEIE